MKIDLTTFIDESGHIASSFDKEKIVLALKNLAGTKARIRVEPDTRTLPQNAYLHSIFGNIADFMYESGVRDSKGEKICLEAWKVWFKKKYGLKEVLELPDGDFESVDVSTAKYNRKELNDFIKQIRHDDLIMDSGLYIKTPDEWKKER